MRVIHNISFLLQGSKTCVTLCLEESILICGHQDHVFGNHFEDVKTIQIGSLSQRTQLGIEISVEFPNALVGTLLPAFILEGSQCSFEVSFDRLCRLVTQDVKTAFVKGSPCLGEERMMRRESEDTW